MFRESKPTVRVEPVDSPLELTESRERVKIKDELLQAVAGVSVRGVSQWHCAGGPPCPGAPMNLPRGLQNQLSSEEVQRRFVNSGDSRVYEAYFPLSGEGWSDATLGVLLPDREHGENHPRMEPRWGCVVPVCPRQSCC